MNDWIEPGSSRNSSIRQNLSSQHRSFFVKPALMPSGSQILTPGSDSGIWTSDSDLDLRTQTSRTQNPDLRILRESNIINLRRLGPAGEALALRIYYTVPDWILRLMPGRTLDTVPRLVPPSVPPHPGYTSASATSQQCTRSRPVAVSK